jgi:hypothetical protein
MAPGAQDVIEVTDLCHELVKLESQHIISNIPNVHEIDPADVAWRKINPEVTGSRD